MRNQAEVTTSQEDRERFIEVRKSEIHGNGLFATCDIPKDELVMVIEGELISREESLRREKEEGNFYIFWNGEHYIDTAGSGKIRHLNHDCHPDCEVMEAEGKGLCLVSARDIRVGEELTIDYGYKEIYESCNCPTCRSKKHSPTGSRPPVQ